MSNKTKIWLAVAFSLVFIGCISFVGVMSMFKWDFTKLSTVKYETNNYEINESFKNISIVTDTADITVVPSEDSKSSVVCYESEKTRHNVSVKDDTLVIEIDDKRAWYDYIGIFWGSPKITVYLPQDEYESLSIKSQTGNVVIPKEFKFESLDISESTGTVTNNASVSGLAKIKTTTGNIYIDNISVGSMALSVSTGEIVVKSVSCNGDVEIKVSTGKTTINDITCKNLISSGSTGSISLEKVTASEQFSIKRSTGDVKFKNCDAVQIFVKTSTGDVKGTLLTEKNFTVKTSTGNVRVPETKDGGRCEITTDTGDIKIEIE